MSVETSTMGRVQTWKQLEEKHWRQWRKRMQVFKVRGTVLLPPSTLNHPMFMQKTPPTQAYHSMPINIKPHTIF